MAISAIKTVTIKGAANKTTIHPARSVFCEFINGFKTDQTYKPEMSIIRRILYDCDQLELIRSRIIE